MTALLDIHNATVYRKEKCVFENLNLKIEEGEATAILGPNGAGKTTLLKLITREIYPVVKTGSYIKLFGDEKVNLWQLREKIGLVSHEFQVAYETLDCGLDVVLSAFFGSRGLYQHHKVDAAQKQKALALMADLHITALADQPFLKLSTGQQRRLLLARALLHQPRALIFDEPCAGLDMAAAFHLLKDLRHWCQQQRTLILVTHHCQEIIPEIERVIFIKNGRVVEDGNKTELLTSKKISELYDCNVEVQENQGYYTAVPREHG